MLFQGKSTSNSTSGRGTKEKATSAILLLKKRVYILLHF